MRTDIFDAVYGCLIGGAIGDALGAPVEGWDYRDIRAKYGKVTEFMPYNCNYTSGKPGVITDDSTLRHYMCLAIVKKGGRITPDDFAEIWRAKLNPRRFWTNEIIIHQRLCAGINPWDGGRGSIPAGCATMAIAPVGIVNAGNPDQAYQDGMNIAAVNQDGENRDFAATFAAGVAAAFVPGATVDDVIEAMFDHSTDLVQRALELTLDLADASADVDEFTEKFYAKMLDWTWTLPPGEWKKERFFSGNSREFMPVVPAIIRLCADDPNRAISEGASFGRDCDTIASLIGNLVGVLYGASALRSDWIAACEEANAEFFAEVEGDPKMNFRAMAERLVNILYVEKSVAEKRANFLGTLLSSYRA